jgi:hypothetical protein
MAWPSSLSSAAECIFPLKDEVTPFALGPRATTEAVFVITEVVTANYIRQDLQPAFLVLRAVSIEVDDLAVVESDTEAFFNKHVGLFLLGKG